MSAETYLSQVQGMESNLGNFAFKSADITHFTSGSDAIKEFEDSWQTPEGRARLSGRSPFALERDRILHSDEFRNQSDKYHTLFYGRYRSTRNYATHTMRVAQVARSISSRLGLNTDLTEAIALGIKVGSLPFIHRSKVAADSWIRETITTLDVQKPGRQTNFSEQLEMVDSTGKALPPSWIKDIKDKSLADKVMKYVPWAAGPVSAEAYTTGQQSYWALSLDPFLLRPKRPYVAQTAYGIWRHSLSKASDSAIFRHSLQATFHDSRVSLSMDETHHTNETMVVRFSDDITWVIENLHEASRVRLSAESEDKVFHNAALHLLSEGEVPPSLQLALTPRPNVGTIYTYFIDNLVKHSKSLMDQAGPGTPSETNPVVQLSSDAARMLRQLKRFLDEQIFNENRMAFRNETLDVITNSALDVMWRSQGAHLETVLTDHAKTRLWTPEQLESALKMLDDEPVHRAQACIAALSDMADSEVYALLGLEI
ncbi:hypothetical protein [Rhodococcus sp. IEGM 1330]|uniref:hypothetical protein n=1 Tax=Rhodococcus sp. IEGM 1330 TaxID=3082225 RepID=UPI0029539B18|nr:hypothetical protein [Rhodococcus sp. IEGM 1330]MDV8022208.1 hypothetical protein [Rhodococcus sp. IEGM 1330]